MGAICSQPDGTFTLSQRVLTPLLQPTHTPERISNPVCYDEIFEFKSKIIVKLVQEIHMLNRSFNRLALALSSAVMLSSVMLVPATQAAGIGSAARVCPGPAPARLGALPRPGAR